MQTGDARSTHDQEESKEPSPTATQRLPEKQRTTLLRKLINVEHTLAANIIHVEHEISTHISELMEHRALRHEQHTTELLSEQRLHQEQHSATSMADVAGGLSLASVHQPAELVGALTSTKSAAAPQTSSGQRAFWFPRRRVPVLHQMSMVECGAASLAMILNYYGRRTSVSEVRQYCGVGRDGLSARAIAQAARSYGLRVRALSLSENDFRFVQLPAIIHWEFNHFLVVERWSPTHVDLVDPALGRRRVTAEEFDQSFTGIVLAFEPGVHFERSTAPRHVSLLTYALSYAKLAPISLLQVLGASLVLQLFGLALPALTTVVVDAIVPSQLKDGMTLLTIGLGILLAAQLTTTLLRSSVLLYLQTRVDTQMMLGFFEQLITLPLHFFQQRSSGDLLARLSSNTVVRDLISNQLVSTLLDSAFVLIYLLILFLTSPLFGLLVLLLSLIQIALLVGSNRRVRELTTRELTAQGKSQSYVAEALVGMITLKAAGAEYRTLQHWTNLFFDQMNASVRRNYVSALVTTVITTLQTFSPVILLVVGTLMVLSGSLSVGTMLGLVALSTAFLTPLSSLVSTGQRLQQIHAHLERIADVMEAEAEQDLSTVHEPPRLTGDVQLDQVSFQYDPHSRPILRNISLRIAPGEKVAIVGRSGSGKTTLGNLLLGLHLPTSGTISYDDLDLRTLNYQAVRAQFGVVTQASTIFSGSVRENIALNNPSISMEQVVRAAKAAAVHEDILHMPMEYETLVSEGGNAISGGQRQRLALARALASEPTLLLLDEATSALDVLTEKIVEQNLRDLACTQIIIAHRLSTIRNADVILVLDGGQIVEQGNHEQLLAQRGYYAQLIEHQLASGEIKAR